MSRLSNNRPAKGNNGAPPKPDTFLAHADNYLKSQFSNWLNERIDDQAQAHEQTMDALYEMAVNGVNSPSYVGHP